jgi:hypothetical protein
MAAWTSTSGRLTLHEARLDDAPERRVGRRAYLDASGDVAREDALLHRRDELLRVDRALVEVHEALAKSQSPRISQKRMIHMAQPPSW